MRLVHFQAILIFISSLVLFLIHFGPQEIIGFESRFYLFALEMWRHGPSVFPTTYQQPYADYPGTSTLLIYFFSKIAGKLTKWTAIFPSAVASALSVTVTFLIGALRAPRLGIAAVLFLLFTLTFVIEARTLSLDAYETLITATCFYLIYSADILQKPQRALWIFPLFLIGFVFRGPIGLVVPVGVVCVFYLLEKNYRQFFKIGIIATCLLALSTTLLLTVAYRVGGIAFLQSVLHMEVLGRLQADGQTPPVYFYFKECLGAFAISYPLALLVLIGFFIPSPKYTTTLHRDLLKFLGWVGIVLIGLSIPGDKKIRYILPIAPALALICAQLFYAPRDNLFLVILKKIIHGFCIIFPLLCLTAIYFILQQHSDFYFYSRTLIILLFVFQILMIVCKNRELLVLALAVLSFFSIIILMLEPINLALNKTQHFVLKAEQIREAMKAQLVFFQEGKDGLVIKYLVNMPHESQPLFIQEESAFSQLKKPIMIIATEEHFQKIPHKNSFLILLRGKIGREPIVVFK